LGRGCTAKGDKSSDRAHTNSRESGSDARENKVKLRAYHKSELDEFIQTEIAIMAKHNHSKFPKYFEPVSSSEGSPFLRRQTCYINAAILSNRQQVTTATDRVAIDRVALLEAENARLRSALEVASRMQPEVERSSQTQTAAAASLLHGCHPRRALVNYYGRPPPRPAAAGPHTQTSPIAVAAAENLACLSNEMEESRRLKRVKRDRGKFSFLC